MVGGLSGKILSCERYGQFEKNSICEYFCAQTNSIMKKLITIIALSFFCLTSYGQSLPVKFLGLPVDGSKASMIQKLQQKGFTYDREADCLEGIFNGKQSNIYVHEYNGKVDRIMVADAHPVSRAEIKKQFNVLLSQFEGNGKYVTSPDNAAIPDDEDIGYEMLVHDKEYAAYFFPSAFAEDVDPEIKTKVAVESMEYVQKLVESGDLVDPTEERQQHLLGITGIRKSIELAGGVVWFKIAKYASEYYICIFYDNTENQANGEDL